MADFLDKLFIIVGTIVYFLIVYFILHQFYTGIFLKKQHSIKQKISTFIRKYRETTDNRSFWDPREE